MPFAKGVLSGRLLLGMEVVLVDARGLGLANKGKHSSDLMDATQHMLDVEFSRWHYIYSSNKPPPIKHTLKRYNLARRAAPVG